MASFVFRIQSHLFKNLTTKNNMGQRQNEFHNVISAKKVVSFGIVKISVEKVGFLFGTGLYFDKICELEHLFHI